MSVTNPNSPWRKTPMVRYERNRLRMEKWGRLTEKKVAQQMEWIEVEIIDSREKSLRVYNGKTKAWIPRSQIEDYSEEQFAVGDTIELELPIWLIEEKGLA